MLLDYNKNDKLRKNDRVLVVRPIEGATVKSSTGSVDPRLFKGGNTLHAILDDRTCLWSLKYSVGGVPEPFKQKFTRFSEALRFAQKYFEKRGLRIESVED